MSRVPTDLTVSRKVMQDLSTREALVLAYIQARLDYSTSKERKMEDDLIWVRVPAQEIAEELGMSGRTVQRSIPLLVKAGKLTTKKLSYDSMDSANWFAVTKE
ncbi:hypothetical protein F862_gp056 [Vibrio phage vB_VpaS_MAR10]|uniref:Uncharacterized protein n=1 Tax=Vibrio phage vB_VpaS_MAR10 TaxID=1229755 RepID=K7R9E7_9CAUD|nr:hypothetical protein F862_gp056 [Vibrio phage vB_VpaS_MAR10]AFV81288.1 hypothetical protein MAR10_055 [Vibrio phage vB_VpaS_MAR10]